MAARRWRQASLALALLILGGLGLGALLESTLVYYRTPAEIVGTTIDPDRELRVAGTVQPGSFSRDGEEFRFVLLADGEALPVRTATVPPSTLTEGEEAVVEGRMSAEGNFVARTVLMKHSNEYRAEDGG